MRILNACTATAILYGAAASAAAAQSCPKPFEQAAFEVVQLKSALMVGALSCGVSTRYDAFMQHFQPYILQEQQVMDRFFHRTGGAAAQVDEDQYVTLLANTQSQDSIAAGKAYCGSVAGLFTQVAAVKQDADLEGLADTEASSAAGLPQPCGAPKPATAVMAANAAAKAASHPAPAADAAASVQNLAAEVPAATPVTATPAAPATAASLAALSRQIQALQAQLASLQAGTQAAPAADRTASAAIPRPNTPS